MLANKLFIQIINKESDDQKPNSSLPIILEYSGLENQFLLSKIKEIDGLELIHNQDDAIYCKYHNMNLLIWIPEIVEAASLFNKNQTALKVKGLENFSLVKLDKAKTEFYSEDKIRSLITLVNAIIMIDHSLFKQLNFWTIHLSIINWSLYFSTYLKIDHFYTNDWKKDVFGFINYQQKNELKITNTSDFDFVNFIIKYHHNDRFNEAYVVANEILREVLLIGDEPWTNLYQKLSSKYSLQKVQEQQKITIYVLLSL